MGKVITVIGLGNILRHDDGVGLVLLDRIRQAMQDVESVDFIDAGIAGMDLIHLIDPYKVVVLIDALQFSGRVGSSKFFSYVDVKSSKKTVSLSNHTEDIMQVLIAADKLGVLPDHVYIFGVQPSDVSYGEGISPELDDSLDDLANQLQKELVKIVELYQK